MARKRKEAAPEGGPAWLITFSDLMTLLLTFFVLLVSMSVIDESRKLVVLASTSSSFGVGPSSFNPLADQGNKENKAEPGAMNPQDATLDLVKDMMLEDDSRDIKFQENSMVQILSINSELLFGPGKFVLSSQGEALLDKMVPHLLQIDYPLLVAGHTAARMDEEGAHYLAELDKTHLDSTWSLSLSRSLAVYRHLTRRGLNPRTLQMEAFGQFRPRYSNDTPQGRHDNRRVDIVLDKRNKQWIDHVERLRDRSRPLPSYYFRDFKFDLDGPESREGTAPEGAR